MSAAGTVPATKLTAESREAVLRAEQNDEEQHCLVCYSPLEFVAKTPCDHNEICGVCHLRLRYLHQDQKCPICKASNATIIVDRRIGAEYTLFEDYPVWGESLGDGFTFRSDVGMFFETSYFAADVEPLFGYRCGAEGCDYDGVTPEVNIYAALKGSSVPDRSDGGADDRDAVPNPIKPTSTTAIRSLQDHLRVKHRLALCGLCVDHQRDFVSQLPRFTPSGLKAHLTTGGNVLGEHGHPLCEFCRPTRFYDFAQLYTHLARDHYKCHVCQQSGLDNQYFKDYKSLERHFDRHHFLCHDVQCLTSRFVVFGSELDLRHHERTVHGGVSDSSSKIQLEFRYRRTIESSVEIPEEAEFNYDLDGQAFVPSAPRPNQSDETTALSLHPLHVQRTESLRRQAQALRQNHGGQDTSFPALQVDDSSDGPEPGISASQRIRLGWGEGVTLQRVAQRQAGQVTEQDFPSLPVAPAGRSKKSGGIMNTAHTSAQRNQASISRQYAAVSAAVSAPSQLSQRGISSSNTTGVRSGTSTVGTPAAASFPSVRESDASKLSADNFPSLGPAPSGGRVLYTAADALARKGGAQQSYMSTTGHPVLQNRHALSGAEANSGQSSNQKPPSLNSAIDFPPPPAASVSRATTTRAPAAHAATSNVLASSLFPLPSPGNAKATVDDMKATLGSSKYKQLKNYTRDFANGTIEAESYIDFSAALFDHGYADFDFWNFIPGLVASTPVDEVAKHRARRYLEQLRKSTLTNRGTSGNDDVKAAPPVQTKPSTQPSQWKTGTPSHNNSTPPPPQVRNYVQTSAPTSQTASIPRVAPGKTKNAWGGGLSSTAVLKAGAKPGSVAVAAAAPIQTGSATKFMAKEKKQEKQSQHQSGSTGSGKANKGGKSQKNELRQLAFGS